MASKRFFGNGKLLLFGEYAVLDGAKALAIPASQGQSMEIKPHRGSDLIWESYDHNGDLWFEAQVSLYDFSSIRTSDEKTSQFIQKLLKGAVRYNTEFLNNWNGFKVINRLDFPREWGLGSSSTVIHNMAQWADINPFHLHFYVSDGSGYDIACAGADGPLVYQVTDDELSYTEIDFEPNYLKKVHFVYLGNKQSSSDGIIHYTKKVKERKRIAAAVTKLTNSALACDNLDDFMTIMNDHEDIMSAALQLPKIKQERFSSFHGAIKSLGAWGGDFAMVASEMSASEVQAYFKGRGCNKIISYQEMLLPEKVEEAVGV